MRRLQAALAALLFVAGCYTPRREAPSPPAAPPPEPVVGLVPMADISGQNAGALVTEILERHLRRHTKVALLPGQGFLPEAALTKALQTTHGGPVIQGRVSAYDFQRQSARRLGPPDYDAVEARAVVSLSLRLGAVTAEAPQGAIVWSRSLIGEDRAVWAENFRQEIGANPLADAFVAPGGLMGVRPAAQMLAAAAERAIETALPDLLRQLERGHSVVSAK